MIWLILIALALGAALAVVLWRLRRVRHHTKLHGPVAILGPLVAPASRPIPRPTMARGMPAVRSQFATPPNDFDQVVVSQPHAPPQRSYAPPQRSYAPPPPPPEPSFVDTPPAGVGYTNGNGDGDSDTATKRHQRTDRTLQFLPGRLEVLAGMGAGTEIRFVRTSGPDGSSITFGRSDGPQYRHVQIDAPTVSRRHARMRWDGSHWTLTNLSATNPVAINGVALPGEGTAIDLSDGDRVEMGEVTFRFHAQ